MASVPRAHATLDSPYAASLAAIPDDGEAQGKAVGEMAAAAMLAEGHDGRTVIGCAFAPAVPGVWQPLPGPFGAPACDPSPWVKDAKPFVVQSASQFRTAGPYPLGSAAYAADYNEVKEIGSLTSTTRMPGQTYAAAFWNTYPAANYNAIARRFVDQFSLDVSDSARLFAMLDLTAADALINTWNDKYHWNFWRPIFAIRQIGADDGNPATDADPTWTPLFSAGFPTSPPLPPTAASRRGRRTAEHAAVSGPPVGRHRLRQCQHARPGVVLRNRRNDLLRHEQPVPGRPTHVQSLLRSDERGPRSPHLGGDPLPNPDVQAATLGRDVERYTHKHLFAAAH